MDYANHSLQPLHRCQCKIADHLYEDKLVMCDNHDSQVDLILKKIFIWLPNLSRRNRQFTLASLDFWA